MTPGPLDMEETDGLDGVEADWRALADASGNVFSTWEWAQAWLTHQGRGTRPFVLRARDASGAVVGLAPLYVTRVGGVRLARLVGHGPADEVGPVCDPRDDAAVCAALTAHPAGRRWNVLLGERLRSPGPWRSAPGARVLNREGSPVVDTADLTWEEYLASRSSNFRSQVRRKERKLVRDHGLAYRLSDDPARLEADMETLFDLHRRRWGPGASGAFGKEREAFHHEFAAVAQRRGWLRLWLAEAEGRAVAAWYGFRFGGADWYYQFGRDPEWDRLSVGLVLLAHTLREAMTDGVAEYRMLRGSEPYKERFATRDPGIETVAVPAGLGGRAAVAAAERVLATPVARRRLVARWS
jgi:CelD/BcsL family acetyltransferase involved in cellulose biosynthesis